jgi:hypothetical protein
MVNVSKARIFSYTSCGTRFLRSVLENVGIDTGVVPQGATHASYETVQNSTSPLTPGDTAIVIYADPRDSFVSLNRKTYKLHHWEEDIPLPTESDYRTFDHDIKIPEMQERPGPWLLEDTRALAMQHLEIKPELITELYYNPFLASEPTPQLWRVWSKFDAFARFFDSWFTSPSRPCPIVFIRYEQLREETTVRKLTKWLRLSPKKSAQVQRDIEDNWRQRNSTYQQLDQRRQHFLTFHFKDLLETQAKLPSVYILEKK